MSKTSQIDKGSLESMVERQADRISTPDGREFSPSVAASPLAFIFAIIREIARLIGKAIMTVWRLAGALDQALWRGFRLSVTSLARLFAASAHFLVVAAVDLVRWLPTRAGRAYTALSAIVLIVCSLWILDELKYAAELEFATLGEERAPVDLDDPILARMGGRYVRLSDITAAAEAAGAVHADDVLTVQSAFERGLVESFVEQRLLARAAIKDGMPRDPEVAQRLYVARDRILAAAYMEQKIAEATAPDAIKRFYDAQADVTRLGDEVRAKHIVVATEEGAREILALLAGGASFEGLATEYSIDRATAPLGGELGYFTKDMMTPVLANAAFTTGKGEIAPLFFSEFGWHVLKVVDRRPTAGVPLGRVEDRIREFLTIRAIEEAVGALAGDREVVYYRPASGAANARSDEEAAGETAVASSR